MHVRPATASHAPLLPHAAMCWAWVVLAAVSVRLHSLAVAAAWVVLAPVCCLVHLSAAAWQKVHVCAVFAVAVVYVGSGSPSPCDLAQPQQCGKWWIRCAPEWLALLAWHGSARAQPSHMLVLGSASVGHKQHMVHQLATMSVTCAEARWVQPACNHGCMVIQRQPCNMHACHIITLSVRATPAVVRHPALLCTCQALPAAAAPLTGAAHSMHSTSDVSLPRNARNDHNVQHEGLQ